MALESKFVQEASRLDYTPGSAVVAGQVEQLDDGRVAAAACSLAANQLGALRAEGVLDLASATAKTFAVGDEVYWDVSGNTAIPASEAALDDLYAGRCLVAKTAGQLWVRTLMNGPRYPQAMPVLCSLVKEIDCETDSDVHTIVPAAWNKNGILILAIYAIVSEVFAGAGEDQGVVTVKDTEAVPNTLGTLTPSDAGGDAIGDVIVGTGKILGGTTGDAVKSVAAGKGVTAACTQATSGDGAAGKMKVRVLFCPLL